ncbi:acyltransferase [Viridibacterium curvum]|uniref:Acyltransferase n=1 Tax=Viridibacterium curvum TaxID=1101404 RepID=A0ABP9QHJ1_9RHOO
MPAWLRSLLRSLLSRDPLPRLLRRGLKIGNNFYMQDDCCIDAWHCQHIRIGNDVTLGPRVIILAHDASMNRALGQVRIAPVVIGDRVFIGAGAIVLLGAQIGSDVIIGAGSVVTGAVQDGMVVAGNPARVIGTTADFLARKEAEIASGPTAGGVHYVR